jgi:GDPmannose 4,6-dehydratase
LRNIPKLGDPRRIWSLSLENGLLILLIAVTSPQDESTPIHAESHFGCAKAFAHQMVQIYRDTHDMFCCNTIAYNHETPRRGENFVTRKISMAAARIKLGLQQELTLGDIKAQRDWGDALSVPS